MSIFGGDGSVELRFKFCWLVSIVLMTVLAQINTKSLPVTTPEGHLTGGVKYAGTASITRNVEDESHGQARCGVTSNSHSFVNIRLKRYLNRRKWRHTNVTWSFLSDRTPLHSKNAHQLDPVRVRAILKRALEVWSKNANISFTEIDTDRANILVSFGGRNFGGSKPAVVDYLAYAYHPGPRRGGDVHFNEHVRWILDWESEKMGAHRLFDVAVHEFGHALGLHHTYAPNSVMNANIQFTLNAALQLYSYRLPEDDRNAIQKLYGAPGRATEVLERGQSIVSPSSRKKFGFFDRTVTVKETTRNG